ncbi:hypothetical protein ACHAWF_012211, partial [Thalassiosira exigua]
YIKDITSLLDCISDLGKLPPNVKLFMMETVLMYININTDHTIEVIGKWLDKLERNGNLPEGFPISPSRKLLLSL